MYVVLPILVFSLKRAPGECFDLYCTIYEVSGVVEDDSQDNLTDVAVTSETFKPAGGLGKAVVEQE